MDTNINLLSIFGLVLLLVLFSKPKLLTLLVVLTSFVQLAWLIRYYSASGYLNWIPLLLGILLGFRLLVDFTQGRKPFLKRYHLVKNLTVIMFILFVVAIYSCMYNGENILLGIFELRYYLHGYIVSLALCTYYRDIITEEYFKKSIVLIALCQIPFSVGKYLLAGGGETNTLDSVTGTFSSYGELNASLLLAIIIILYDSKKVKAIIKWNPYFLSLVLTIPLLLSQSRTATAFLFLVVIYAAIVPMIIERKTFRTLTRLMPLILVGIGFLLLLYRFFWLGAYDIETQLSSEYVSDYFMKDASSISTQYSGSNPIPMGRISAVLKAFQLIGSNFVNTLIGFGSGATSESKAVGSHGLYYYSNGPLYGLGGNELSKTVMEFGISAFIILIALGVKLKRGIRQLPKLKANAMNRLYLHILLVLSMLSWYTTTLSGYFMSIVVGGYIALVQIEIDRFRVDLRRKN